MTLLEVVENINKFSEEHTIYVRRPWMEEAMAVVALETTSGKPPVEAADLDLSYFLEISVARAFLNDWAASQKSEPSIRDKCARLVQYAINDA